MDICFYILRNQLNFFFVGKWDKVRISGCLMIVPSKGTFFFFFVAFFFMQVRKISFAIFFFTFFSPESVIKRFEQRDHAVDSRGVAEYLRALVVTNAIAEYLPDEETGKPSSLPTLVIKPVLLLTSCMSLITLGLTFPLSCFGHFGTWLVLDCCLWLFLSCLMFF